MCRLNICVIFKLGQVHKNLCWFINQTTYCACGINTSNCLVRKASWLALPSSCKSASVKSIDELLCLLPGGWWGHMSHRHTSYQPWLQQMQSLRQIHFSTEWNNNCYQPALWRPCIAASLTSPTLQCFSYTHILCLYRDSVCWNLVFQAQDMLDLPQWPCSL